MYSAVSISFFLGGSAGTGSVCRRISFLMRQGVSYRAAKKEGTTMNMGGDVFGGKSLKDVVSLMLANVSA